MYSDKICGENQTDFIINIFFPEDHVVYETSNATDGSGARALCVLDNQDYKRTLRIYNTYCLSIANASHYGVMRALPLLFTYYM
jgi:hypothetical protein